MHTAAYKVDVASDRRRRKNVPRHILCYALTGISKIFMKTMIFFESEM